MSQRPLIGIIGGICSGKTTLAQEFQKLGAGIIDTDHIARQLLQPGSSEFQAVLAHFGSEILEAQGQLNRPLLKKRIFNNPSDKIWLENLLHPRIRAEVQSLKRTLDFPYLIVLIPLLKSRAHYPLDYVLSLEVPPEIQLQRLQARDKISKELAERIVATQPTAQARAQLADAILDTEPSLEKLKPEIQKWDRFFRNLTSSL